MRKSGAGHDSNVTPHLLFKNHWLLGRRVSGRPPSIRTLSGSDLLDSDAGSSQGMTQDGEEEQPGGGPFSSDPDPDSLPSSDRHSHVRRDRAQPGRL